MKKSIPFFTLASSFLLSGAIFFLVSCAKKDKAGEKVLHLPVSAKIKGMDPIYTNDRYSVNAVGRVYEGLLSYHYLKRPFVLEPNLALAMPQVQDGGKTYTFKLRPGVLFHDDKCFPGGKGREMVAQDVVYSFKRTIANPKALGWWVIDGKIAGGNDFREKVAKGKATMESPIEGLKALDRYTVQFKLTEPFPQFLYAFAMTFFFVVPHEAVKHYGEEFINHPVGTGPFTLKEFKRTNRIVLHKNPTFRKKLYPSEGTPEDRKEGLLADAGKQLPLVDKLVIHINVESQPRWLSFQAGKLDLLEIPKDNFDTVVTPSRNLSPKMKKKGIKLHITPALDVTYTAFQHKNKLFSNLKLRRAMSLANDPHISNNLFYSSTALVAQSIIPPGIAGFISGFKNQWVGPDVKRAKKLLAEAGYPGGKGLPVITFDTSASTVSRQIGEFFKKRMDLIGIKVQVITNPWPELQKKIQTAQTMIHSLAWGADYPDAHNFLQLLYGPNKAPGSNGSNYNDPEFNQLFESIRTLHDSPERTKLYEKMYKIAADRLPWIYGVHRQSFIMTQGWLKNFKKMEFEQGTEQYLSIDLEKKKQLQAHF
ncbi:MAG: ABC transporter substrate-binding protein [Bacteriovoracales bacterium]|nr:ABC transporter substrate-binding protein [Bacteriovoracales bacterium]